MDCLDICESIRLGQQLYLQVELDLELDADPGVYFLDASLQHLERKLE